MHAKAFLLLSFPVSAVESSNDANERELIHVTCWPNNGHKPLLSRCHSDFPMNAHSVDIFLFCAASVG